MHRLFDFSVATHPQYSFFHICLCVLLCAASIHAASLPPGFTESQFGGAGANIASPTAMAFAPDGRLFVCQQTGSLRVIKNGTLLATPFLTLSVDSTGERGLLGVAFDPNFANNQFVYVYYTTSVAPIHNRVSRFTATGDVAAAGETVILDLNNLSGATNHNGGAIHFGLDGKLYISVGDNANASNSQTFTNLLGKMLRINADGTIPADNPFFGSATGNNRAIWALGFRNPFTFNFLSLPGLTRMFINDVGEVTWEEINNGIAGRNYGWSTCEGNCNPPNASFTDPIYQYAHNASGGCAIVGAAFYNPPLRNFPPEYVSKYFFTDLCMGWVRYLDPFFPQSVRTFATGLSNPVDLQVGPDGALYYLQRGNGGQVWRVVYGAFAMIQGKKDFDGDGKTDFAVWRPSDGTWYIILSSTGQGVTQQWGFPADIPVPGDYDNDGKTDIAVWRPSDGIWYIIRSSTGQGVTQQWGFPADIPVPGDYDNDGKTDIAVWRPLTGVWWILFSSNGQFTTQQWGFPADIPVPGDYDNDGKTDIAVWRPLTGVWWILFSSNGQFATQQWGGPSDVPVPGDYDNDGRADYAVWRPAEGTWYVIRSSNFSALAQQWGGPGDVPVPGSYDTDGRTDFAVWRPGNGVWYALRSSNYSVITQSWGVSGDVPVPSR